MSETKHTPGPWKTGPINYADIYDADSDGPIALVVKDRPSTVADARLIAEAPMLLEHCKDLAKRLELALICLGSSNEIAALNVAKANAVISRVEGR